jgi:uncharacterized protein with HEPN domain
VSSRDWKLRIQDILDAIGSIQNKTEGMSFDDFEADETLVKAVLYDFIVIGEAATRVPTEIQFRYPDIPWRLMGDLRNVVTHQYFQVRLTIIWSTLKNNLPPLITGLEYLLQQEE